MLVAHKNLVTSPAAACTRHSIGQKALYGELLQGPPTTQTDGPTGSIAQR